MLVKVKELAKPVVPEIIILNGLAEPSPVFTKEARSPKPEELMAATMPEGFEAIEGIRIVFAAPAFTESCSENPAPPFSCVSAAANPAAEKVLWACAIFKTSIECPPALELGPAVTVKAEDWVLSTLLTSTPDGFSKALKLS